MKGYFDMETVTRDTPGLGGTVPAELLGKIKMIQGQENITPEVIDQGQVKLWVGFGWITLREATETDYRQYPVVTRE